MKQIFVLALLFFSVQLYAQPGRKFTLSPKAYIDLSKPPYNMKAGMSAALACEQAIESLYRNYQGGKVFLPFPYNWDRPNPKTQKGVRLRSNITIEGVGQRLTLINNCPWFSSDFGTDSLGFEINGNLESSMTSIPVVSSAGAKVGDTVYGRFGTAPYDAGEPAVFGWFTIKAVPNVNHIVLSRPCGAQMQVAGTASKNRRLIRVRQLVSNVVIKNLEFYSNRPFAEAGVYIQGGFFITVDNIRATNPGTGLANFQFCERCVLKNSTLDSSASQGNANWGRGVTLSECVDCEIRNNRFNKYQTVAVDHEANNPGAKVIGNVFNNNFNNSARVAVVSLGSGDILLDSNRFTGFQQTLYDQVKSFGKVKLRNTTVDKGTPFNYYEQQGVETSGFLHVGDAKFRERKTYTKTFTLPVNGTYAVDDLPKGWIIGATIKVDDNAGITSFYFRRDNSYTNNSVNFADQLRPGKAISPNVGAGFQIGAGLSKNALNYTLDKSFVVTTSGAVKRGNNCTITITYLEGGAGK